MTAPDQCARLRLHTDQETPTPISVSLPYRGKTTHQGERHTYRRLSLLTFKTVTHYNLSKDEPITPLLKALGPCCSRLDLITKINALLTEHRPDIANGDVAVGIMEELISSKQVIVCDSRMLWEQIIRMAPHAKSISSMIGFALSNRAGYAKPLAADNELNITRMVIQMIDRGIVKLDT